MSDNSDDFVLRVTFKNAAVSEETLLPLSQTIEKAILAEFGSVGAAKTAFDSHKSCPCPNDPVQKIMAKIDDVIRDCLSRDFGPSTIRTISPCVRFERN